MILSMAKNIFSFWWFIRKTMWTEILPVRIFIYQEFKFIYALDFDVNICRLWVRCCRIIIFKHFSCQSLSIFMFRDVSSVILRFRFKMIPHRFLQIVFQSSFDRLFLRLLHITSECFELFHVVFSKLQALKCNLPSFLILPRWCTPLDWYNLRQFIRLQEVNFWLNVYYCHAVLFPPQNSICECFSLFQ